MYICITTGGWMIISTVQAKTSSVCSARTLIHSGQPSVNLPQPLGALNICATSEPSDSPSPTELRCLAGGIIFIIVAMVFCGAQCIFFAVKNSCDRFDDCVFNYHSALDGIWHRRSQLQCVGTNVVLCNDHGLSSVEATNVSHPANPLIVANMHVLLAGPCVLLSHAIWQPRCSLHNWRGPSINTSWIFCLFIFKTRSYSVTLSESYLLVRFPFSQKYNIPNPRLKWLIMASVGAYNDSWHHSMWGWCFPSSGNLKIWRVYMHNVLLLCRIRCWSIW